MTHLRAALIGMGAMGRNHLRVLSSLDDVDVVGVVEPHSHPDDRIDVPIWSDLAAVVRARPDFCVVATPTASHAQLALELADAGIHTLVEKPLADTVDAARTVADAFRQQGLVGGVGHIERFNPALQSMRHRLEAGDLGDVFQVATRRQGPMPTRIRDVGVVLDLASHDLDLTAWLLQDTYATVAARTSYRTGRPHEDLVAVVGSMQRGTIANHLVNWLSPLKERLTVVTGARGCFVADTLNGELTLHRNGASEWGVRPTVSEVSEGDVTRFALERREPLRTELEAFTHAVRTGDVSQIVTMEQGLHVLEVAEAVQASAPGEPDLPTASDDRVIHLAPATDDVAQLASVAATP